MTQIRNAIFVDLDSMNVLFKMEDKFVAALSYAEAAERLSEVTPAFGSGYDVYLCLKPRVNGCGDFVIEELSIIGMPFTVNSEELYRALKFFRSFHGVSDVYLCNWVQNYIAQARVKSFDSVVYYGNGVARIKADNHAVSYFGWWPSQKEFSDAQQVNDETYGDLGLIDVDGFVSQYPEFSDISKAHITAIAPLAHCYKTSVVLETTELYTMLRAKYEEGQELRYMPKDTQVEPTAIEDPAIQSKELTTPVEEGLPEVKTIRTPVPWVAKIAFVACALLALVAGSVFGVTIKGSNVPNNTSYYGSVTARIAELQEIIPVYRDALDRNSRLIEAYDYCHKSEISLTIVGFDANTNNYSVRYNCVSESESEAFIAYISSKYAVESTSDLGATAVEGVQMRQFSVMFR